MAFIHGRSVKEVSHLAEVQALWIGSCSIIHTCLAVVHATGFARPSEQQWNASEIKVTALTHSSSSEYSWKQRREDPPHLHADCENHLAYGRINQLTTAICVTHVHKLQTQSRKFLLRCNQVPIVRQT
jgi:hypothetical protein